MEHPTNGPNSLPGVSSALGPLGIRLSTPVDSFETLYDFQAPLLRHIAVRKFGVPVADADALVHDVFATYFTCPAKVRDVRSYLIGGICNAARSYWRRRKDEETLFVQDPEPCVLDPDPVDAVAQHLALNATLAQLGTRCREVLVRYYLNDESTPSIAEAMGTTRHNVHYLLHTCRLRARRVFHELTQTR